MTRHQDTVRDPNQAIVPGAKIYVFLQDGQTLATLADDSGNALPNPVVSDTFGTFYYNVATPGAYWEHTWYNGREQTRELVPVGLASDAVFKGDPGTPGTNGAPGSPGAGVNSPPGIAGNGTTDDRAAIAAYDTALGAGKEFWLPAGTYRIASNLTIASRVRFMKGAIIKPDAGVTVTFSGGVEVDQFSKCFDVSNAGAYCWALSGNLTQFSWGAVGNGATDDSYAFQMLVDNQLYFQHAPIRPAPGDHAWASTVFLNYGSANASDYRSGFWIGPGTKYNRGGTFAGLAITYTGYENAIEVTGCRQFVFYGTTLKGNFYAWISAQNFANGGVVPLVDPGLPESWLPSTANPIALSRYKMCSGIHVDPRGGAKPTAAAWVANTNYTFGTCVKNGGNLYVNYAWAPGVAAWSTSANTGGPTGTGATVIVEGTCRWFYVGPDTTSIAYSDVTYPPYAGGSNIYNKPVSSRVFLRDSEVVGFGCNVAVKGCNASSNGDYVGMENTNCSYGVFPFSWGNNQARLFDAHLCLFGQSFCVASSCVIGQQQGFAHLSLRNCETGSSQQMVAFPNAAAGASIVLDNCYGEGCNRIGEVWSAGGSGTALKLAGGNFSFIHTSWWRVPNNIIDVSGTCLEISGMARFSSMRCPLVIKGEPRLCRIEAEITSPLWMSAVTDVSPISPITVGEAIMLRSTHSIVFMNALNGDQGPWTGFIRDGWGYNLTTGVGRLTVNVGAHALSDISNPIPFCAQTTSPSNRGTTYPVPVALGGSQARLVGNSTVTAFSEGARLATITLSAGQNATNLGTACNLGFAKGSMIYHLQSSSLFVVTDLTGSVITAKRLNDWYTSNSLPVPAIDSVGTGNWYFIPCGHYMPSVGVEMTYTSASAAVTFAHSDGSTAAITDFKVTVSSTDYFATKVVVDSADAMAPVLSANSSIAASPTPANGSFSFSGNARKTTVERAGLWFVPRGPG